MERVEVSLPRTGSGKPDNFDDVVVWLDDNVGQYGADWSYKVRADEVIYRFAQPSKAVLFKLTHGGV